MNNDRKLKKNQVERAAEKKSYSSKRLQSDQQANFFSEDRSASYSIIPFPSKNRQDSSNANYLKYSSAVQTSRRQKNQQLKNQKFPFQNEKQQKKELKIKLNNALIKIKVYEENKIRLQARIKSLQQQNQQLKDRLKHIQKEMIYSKNWSQLQDLYTNFIKKISISNLEIPSKQKQNNDLVTFNVNSTCSNINSEQVDQFQTLPLFQVKKQKKKQVSIKLSQVKYQRDELSPPKVKSIKIDNQNSYIGKKKSKYNLVQVSKMLSDKIKRLNLDQKMLTQLLNSKFKAAVDRNNLKKFLMAEPFDIKQQAAKQAVDYFFCIDQILAISELNVIFSSLVFKKKQKSNAIQSQKLLAKTLLIKTRRSVKQHNLVQKVVSQQQSLEPRFQRRSQLRQNSSLIGGSQQRRKSNLWIRNEFAQR